MVEFQFRPIERWPGEPCRSRRRAAFRSPYSATLKLLERELEFLKARQVIVQADCASSEIRRDGQLRSDARLKGPGIILSFESRHGPLQYPCDAFTDWQDNLRAIALGLEALRAVDRYGVTRQAQQYRGWQKLAAPAAAAFASVTDAIEWLARHQASFTAEAIATSADAFRTAYREAAARLHPDRNGGDDSEFKRLQAAKDQIERQRQADDGS